MSDLADRAEGYLRLRRMLGHELAEAARLLPRFVAYLDHIGAEVITVEAALIWAQQPQARPGGKVQARRMTVALPSRASSLRRRCSNPCARPSCTGWTPCCG